MFSVSLLMMHLLCTTGKKIKKLKILNFYLMVTEILQKKWVLLLKKNNLGFGDRSWRYSMLVDNGNIIKIFSELNMSNNHKTDPFSVSSVHNMINFRQKLIIIFRRF